MSKAIPLLPLWAFGACYWANFYFTTLSSKRLFSDLAKVSWKAVLLHKGSEFPSAPLARAAHIKGTHERESSGFAAKMRYEEHVRMYELT
jgi:hypothetical protein